MYDDSEMLQCYSAALDEIYRLRTALAIEAVAVEAHLRFKTFPKSQRPYAQRQIERMRAAARGEVEDAYRKVAAQRGKTAMWEAGASETLTRGQWEAGAARGPVTDVAEFATPRDEISDDDMARFDEAVRSARE